MGFWWGVLAGIVATVIVSVIIPIVRYFIFAAIGQYVFEKVSICFPRARNLSGTWETEFKKDDTSYKETAKVSQLFGKVWGTIEFNKAGQLRKYRMVGSFKEPILSATYEILSPKEPLDRGSFTLALSWDGMRLEGCYSWTDDESKEPKGAQYVWTKLRSQ